MNLLLEGQGCAACMVAHDDLGPGERWVCENCETVWGGVGYVGGDEELPEAGVVYRAQPESFGLVNLALYSRDDVADVVEAAQDLVRFWESRGIKASFDKAPGALARAVRALKPLDPNIPPPVLESGGPGTDHEIKLGAVADAVADFDDVPGEGTGEDSEPGPEGDTVFSDGSGGSPESARWEAIRRRLDPANNPGGNRDPGVWAWDGQGGRSDYSFARQRDVRLAYRWVLALFRSVDRFVDRQLDLVVDAQAAIVKRLQIVEDRVLESGGQGRSGGGEDQEGGGDEGLEGHGGLLSEGEGPNYPSFQVEVNSEDLARVLMAASELEALTPEESRSAGALAYIVDVCRNVRNQAAGSYSQPSQLHHLFRND